jgi:ABC-2 type transport system permease protein
VRSSLKSEFRKLLTVRSTYIITGLIVALIVLIAFYGEGWRLNGLALLSPNQLSSDVTGGLNLTLFSALIAILLMTYEYRHNTIGYTFTSSQKRSTVLLSKIITVSAYSLFLAILVGILSPLLSYLGVLAHGNTLVHQNIDIWDLAWRGIYYSWGYGMAGLLIATLVRSQVAAIAALLLIPNLIEPLLILLLRKNAIYLPFSALGQLLDRMSPSGGSLSAGKAALVFTGYLIVSWAIVWYLFLERDAE